MARFFKLKVVDVVKETADSVSIAFEVPPELKEEFKYIQGQYLTLKLYVNGEELRRSYSICSSPVADSELRIAIKKVKDGKGSIYLNEKVKPGDIIEMMQPMGNFYTELNPGNKKNYVLFAGGSGITPMLSILKTTLHTEPKSNIIMFYGNQDEASIIFKKQLDQLAEKYPGRLSIYHILNEPELKSIQQELLTGIMIPSKNKALLEKFVNLNQVNEYFICGPAGMMTSVVETLQNLKVAKSNIHLEYFTVPVDTSEIVEKPSAAIPGNSPFTSKVTIICDGNETVVELGADDNILQAALDANVDAPYACRGGSCCTCRAKLIEGKVEMKVNYALLDSEVKQGYILTCQSQPLTPVVVVDYDKGR